MPTPSDLSTIDETRERRRRAQEEADRPIGVYGTPSPTRPTDLPQNTGLDREKVAADANRRSEPPPPPSEGGRRPAAKRRRRRDGKQVMSVSDRERQVDPDDRPVSSLDGQEVIEATMADARAEQADQWENPETLATVAPDAPSQMHAADTKPGGRHADPGASGVQTPPEAKPPTRAQLRKRTKTALAERAAELGIKGRSNMDHEGLVDAVFDAERAK